MMNNTAQGPSSSSISRKPNGIGRSKSKRENRSNSAEGKRFDGGYGTDVVLGQHRMTEENRAAPLMYSQHGQSEVDDSHHNAGQIFYGREAVDNDFFKMQLEHINPSRKFDQTRQAEELTLMRKRTVSGSGNAFATAAALQVDTTRVGYQQDVSAGEFSAISN
jgi:hypothetical protein